MKKSQSLAMKNLIWLIIGIGVLGLLTSVYIMYKNQQAPKAIDNMCKSSVITNSRLRVGIFSFAKEIKCKTQEWRLDEKNTDEAKAKIAYRLYKCADNFGNGKLNLFSESSGTFCAICDIIDVKRETITGFDEYLNTHNPPGINVSYSQYLIGSETPNFNEVIRQKLASLTPKFESNANIENNKKYAIIFVYVKGQDNVKKFVDTITGHTTAAKVGYGLGGATGFSVGIAVISTVAAVSTGGISLGAAAIIMAVSTATGTAAGITAAYAITDMPEYMGFTYLTEYNDYNIRALQCDMLVPNLETMQANK